MSYRVVKRILAPLAALALLATPLSATDGHFLHGVGAVNASMGGAGVASADLLGSFYLNPAGLALIDETAVSLGFELFRPDRSVTSNFGSFVGSTDSKSEFVPIPAFGWASRVSDAVTVGLGGLGIGGFGVDYPADPNNPILTPRPSGFGQVYSNFSLLKISPALAYQPTDGLAVGVSLNFDWATLAVDPMPVASPAGDPGADGIPGTPDDRGFYSRATSSDGAFGMGFQLGLQYQAHDRVRLGAAYTSPQWFQDFEFNAMWENPFVGGAAEGGGNAFGMPREMTFAMDVPAVYAAGIAVVPTRALTVSGDVRYITYSDTEGFENRGFDQTGAVQGFGWDDIFVFAGGLELRAHEAVQIRGGYNYSQNPIGEDVAAFNIPAPAVVQHHLTLGLGFAPTAWMNIDAAYYRAFENSVSGDFVTPVATLGTTSSLSEDSFLVQFSFNPNGRR